MPELLQVDKAPETTIITGALINDARKSRLAREKEELEKLEKEFKESESSERVGLDRTETEGDDLEKETEGSQSEGLSKEEETFKKRYGDLRRHAQKREEELKARIAQLESGQGNQVRPPAKDEDIEAWAKRYPDVARIVETIAQKKAKEMFSSAEHRLEEYEKAKAETERTKAENTIRKAHGDFDDIKSSDEFHDWAEAQPKWVQDAVYENADDPASVIRVLDLYKVDMGMTPSASRSRDKEAAQTVSKRTKTSLDSTAQKGTYRESEVAKMSDKQFREHSDAIDKAIKSGKFIYDLT